MPIDVICSCGKKMQAPDEYAGRKGRCKACGTGFVIPALVVDGEPTLGVVAPSTSEVSRPRRFWRDPILLAAIWIPAVILAAFGVYLLTSSRGRKENAVVSSKQADAGRTVAAQSVDIDAQSLPVPKPAQPAAANADGKNMPEEELVPDPHFRIVRGDTVTLQSRKGTAVNCFRDVESVRAMYSLAQGGNWEGVNRLGRGESYIKVANGCQGVVLSRHLVGEMPEADDLEIYGVRVLSGPYKDLVVFVGPDFIQRYVQRSAVIPLPVIPDDLIADLDRRVAEGDVFYLGVTAEDGKSVDRAHNWSTLQKTVGAYREVIQEVLKQTKVRKGFGEVDRNHWDRGVSIEVVDGTRVVVVRTRDVQKLFDPIEVRILDGPYKGETAFTCRMFLFSRKSG